MPKTFMEMIILKYSFYNIIFISDVVSLEYNNLQRFIVSESTINQHCWRRDFDGPGVTWRAVIGSPASAGC